RPPPRISRRRCPRSTRRSRRRSCARASDGEPPVAARKPPSSLTLSPLDNRALANLCGPLDANLRQIEAACDVAITHRGGTFTIAGEPAQAARARAALERFYAAAEKPLSVDDIQLGLVEIATRGARAPA